MESIDLFNKANSTSGNWLPGVETCLHRAQPCGNAYCADEAIRAAQIPPNGIVNGLIREHALNHSHKIAKNCRAGVNVCPFEANLGLPRHDALSLLFNVLDQRNG